MKCDLVVIGGGPAGMIAVGQAGKSGASVILIEKNKNLGTKLLITGKGRCNITNNTLDIKELVKAYGPNGKFLFSALNMFGVPETIDFFESRGLETKVERGNRVFPKSDKSADVLKVLLEYIKENQVIVKTGNGVKKIIKKDSKIEKIILDNGEEIIANNYLIATGGLSYPETGSTGDGYDWLRALGHKIKPLNPALTPLILREKLVKELEGLSLKNVQISVFKNNKKTDSRFGEALFTANGLSGPVVLDLSKNIVQEPAKEILIKIDFKPALDFKQLDQRIQRDFQENNNKMYKNSLDKILPQKLIPVIIKRSGINPDKKVNLITREERQALVKILKEFVLTYKSAIGYDKAIITSGGVDLKEIDPKTMKSKLIDNLYLAGEILDLDGPTGGYNLQVCWTTGYVAGQSVK